MHCGIHSRGLLGASFVGALACITLFPASNTWAQVDYFQTFDSPGEVASGQFGPSGLISAGWIFRRQANPPGLGTWRLSSYAYEGPGSLGIHSVTQVGGTGRRVGDPPQDFFDFLAAFFEGC